MNDLALRADRLWPRVRRSEGCWEWTGCLKEGYGQLSIDGKRHSTHRLAYELLVGPIPKGLVLDHLCRNHACCNPAHLEPVTHKENIRRGEGPTARNARKTHCKRGHAFTVENTWLDSDGNRECRTCRRVLFSGWARKQRAAP